MCVARAICNLSQGVGLLQARRRLNLWLPGPQQGIIPCPLGWNGFRTSVTCGRIADRWLIRKCTEMCPRPRIIRGGEKSRTCGGGCCDPALCVVCIRCGVSLCCGEALAGIWTSCGVSRHICGPCYNSWRLTGQCCGTDALRRLSDVTLVRPSCNIWRYETGIKMKQRSYKALPSITYYSHQNCLLWNLFLTRDNDFSAIQLYKFDQFKIPCSTPYCPKGGALSLCHFPLHRVVVCLSFRMERGLRSHFCYLFIWSRVSDRCGGDNFF